MPLTKGQKINRPPRPVAERFAESYRVDEETGCWLWTKRVGDNGYAHFFVSASRQNRLAHRVSYELHVGPIPEGLTLDHLCRVRHCVNPAHLEPVTTGDNTRRGGNAAKTRCKHGHEFTPENTYLNPDGSGRRCRDCMREDTRRWRRRPRG